MEAISHQTKQIVLYRPDGIMIFIPTQSAAALHDLLLKGLSAAFHYYTLSADKRPTDADALASLLELQKTLQPAENELQRAYT